MYFVFLLRKAWRKAPYLAGPFKCLHPDLFVCQLVPLAPSPFLTGAPPLTLLHPLLHLHILLHPLLHLLLPV